MFFKVIILFLLIVNSVHANSLEFESLYAQILANYWHPTINIHGVNTTVFDYAEIKKDADKPNSLFKKTLRAIEQTNISQFKSPSELKAFWINAHNFTAINLVINNYPVDSIRSLKISLVKYPWSKKTIRISNTSYSLKQIEKDILLKEFDDPRIVFAVSCAAVSCPDRTAEAFTAEKLEEQLDEMIRIFFKNSRKGLKLNRDTKTLTLSWILKKDIELFGNKEEEMLKFVLPYLDPEMLTWLSNNPVEIDYFEHDWTLNDLAQADN